MPNVVIGQALHPEAIAELQRGLGPDYNVIDRGSAPLPELLKALESADYVITQSFTPQMGEHARKLKLLHAQGSGTDGIARAALPQGAYVANVYEHEVAIAEYIYLAMLALSRDLLNLDAGLRRGDMGPAGHYGGPMRGELYGTTVAIIGYGRIGREVAKRAKVFGQRVLAIKGHPEAGLAERDGLAFLGGPSDLATVLPRADYVVVATPLTPETTGLIGAREIALMKPTAFLINVGRGPVVAEEPLYRALRDRKIAGAALDVWYTYPPVGQLGQPSNFPFQSLSNVIMTPHIAGWTHGTVNRRMAFIAENIKRVESGHEPISRVI
ncbi:MAG TPA: 2-hydroxyacid dehydrogenase [Chloroflexota bacterium]|nr:2-hydroxyacid dehydrogenase [Chloroflexota bacterium]